MKLTTDETAKVLAMYLGNSIDVPDYEPETLTGVDAFNYTVDTATSVDAQDTSWYDLEKVKLLLTPLCRIKDEDEKARHKIMEKYEGDAIGYAFMYQYLISKGYAVPLWFAVDHWANGKTALELLIAIEN